MTACLEPREVDKPFIGRWLRVTLQLFARSPIRFGAAIALLGWLDWTATDLASGYVVHKQWINRLGMLLLPVIWTLVSAIARGADDPGKTWSALAGFTSWRLWRSVLLTGATFVALDWVITASFHGLVQLLFHPKTTPYLQQPGQFLDSIAIDITLFTFVLGICYFPLLVFWPRASVREVWALARKASDVNGDTLIGCFVAVLALSADSLTKVVPAHGMTTALYLVFLGTLSYVAYRDIFEGRSGNVPRAAPTPALQSNAARPAR